MSAFKVLIGCCLLVAPLLGQAQDKGAGADSVAIEGMNLKRTLDCQGRDVDISGEGNTVTLKGRCGQVALYGAHHRLVLDDAQALDVHGVGSSIQVRGAVAALSLSGGYQQVQANVRGTDAPAKVDAYGYALQARLHLLSRAEVAVGGSSQQVYWTRAAGVPEPQTQLSGAGNVLAANPDVPALANGDQLGLNATP